MVKNANKFQVNLNTSITYDNISTDIQPFDDSARLVDANTITRNGGLNNNNLTTTPASIVGNYFFTDNGDKLCINSSGEVFNNDKKIGQVDPYGVEKRNSIGGVSDVVLTTGGYITTALSGTVMTITEYLDDGTQVNSRTVNFTGLASISSFITSVNIIRQSVMAYGNSFEWVIRLGDQISFLQESNPSATIYQYLQSTTVVGSN